MHRAKPANPLLLVAMLLSAACSREVEERTDPNINPIDVVIASAVSEVANRPTVGLASDTTSNPVPKVRGVVRILPTSLETHDGHHRRIEVKWNGAIEPLVRLAARYFGYGYRAETNRPSSPVTVNLSLSDATLRDILAATNQAANGLARVEIGERRSLKLTYAR